MATYNITSISLLERDLSETIAVGDILICPYDNSQAEETITLPVGTYKLECWGAQGGQINNLHPGGKGGYASGNLNLIEKQALYLHVGGSGNNGGRNGGGKATSVEEYGGGASDISFRTQQTLNEDYRFSRVIVAGGGGGCGYAASFGGAAGGITGFNGDYNGSAGTIGYGGGNNEISPNTNGVATYAGLSARQPSSYSTSGDNFNGFGWGGNSGADSVYIAAGGGGWYGGCGGYAAKPTANRKYAGGGGSSYVYTSATASDYPVDPAGLVSLSSDKYLTDTSIIDGDSYNAMLQPDGTYATGRAGDGYIRITVIALDTDIGYCKTSASTWSPIVKGYYKYGVSSWQPINKGYTKTSSGWKQIF